MKHLFISHRLATRGILSAVTVSALMMTVDAQTGNQTGDSATFRTRVNLVMVPVVVRDRDGRAIGTLKKEDFQLFDKDKLQKIEQFTVEKGPASPANGSASPAEATSTANADQTGAKGAAPSPERFVIYLFDDVHLKMEDIIQARKAADRTMQEVVGPTSRFAIYTTSGLGGQDFTDNLSLLREALNRVRPRSKAEPAGTCTLSYFLADLVVKGDQGAFQAARTILAGCSHLDLKNPPDLQIATQLTKTTAQQVQSLGDIETRSMLMMVKAAVRRLEAMPGQRSIVLVSPGFIVADDQRSDESEVFDRAIRANVIINSIDARGLYVMPGMEASDSVSGGPQAVMIRQSYDREEAQRDNQPLVEFADATGGNWVHNTNDLESGFRRVAAPPEFYYVLGFSPADVKADGSFHALKVKVANAHGLTVQARHGYFAPRSDADSAQLVRKQIQEVLLAHEEISDIPIELSTGTAKQASGGAAVTVMTRIDLRAVALEKRDGQNQGVLTVVACLFDSNGKYINDVQKQFALHVSDEKLQSPQTSVVTIPLQLNAAPGAYSVRVVVRDEAGNMAARNGKVDVPQ